MEGTSFCLVVPLYCLNLQENANFTESYSHLYTRRSPDTIAAVHVSPQWGCAGHCPLVRLVNYLFITYCYRQKPLPPLNYPFERHSNAYLLMMSQNNSDFITEMIAWHV